MRGCIYACLAAASLFLAGAPLISSAQAQTQPGARPGERAIIFVGGKKKVIKRKVKRVTPRDQRSINPQPLPPRAR